jgi:hypothetical protein
LRDMQRETCTVRMCLVSFSMASELCTAHMHPVKMILLQFQGGLVQCKLEKHYPHRVELLEELKHFTKRATCWQVEAIISTACKV